jgi:prevent-host-death family protein
MTQVGARELRHRLSEYLARVDAGERFEVTLRGRPVGQLGPVDASEGIIARLIREGKVTPAKVPNTTPMPERYPAIPGRPTATEELLAERRSDPR